MSSELGLEEEEFSFGNLFKPCILEKVEKPTEDNGSTESTSLLLPEDEISISSIVSYLLGVAVPSEEDPLKCTWDLDAREVLSEKNSITFDETLFISVLKNTNCKLSETSKVFLERELEQVGRFCLGIEESFDGYVVICKSQIFKKGSKSGHTLKGKYTDRFVLICEKRTEYDYVDNAKIEKSLEVRNYDDEELVAFRETVVNQDYKKLKAVIQIKDSSTTFLCDGGVLLLMRYLVVNNFLGTFKYYSMNVFGKILRGALTINFERKTVRIFFRTFKNCKRVINTHYFNDVPQEIAETYFTPEGYIVLHFWHGYNYVLHQVCKPIRESKNKILPKLEIMWKSDNALFRNYQMKKALNYENIMCFLNKRPDFGDLLEDYLLCLLQYKPTDVMQFTMKYFQNMKADFDSDDDESETETEQQVG